MIRKITNTWRQFFQKRQINVKYSLERFRFLVCPSFNISSLLEDALTLCGFISKIKFTTFKRN